MTMVDECSSLLPNIKAPKATGPTRYQWGMLAIFIILWVAVTQSEAAQALQVFLLPLVYVYHVFYDAKRESMGLGFLEVLQRHSLFPLRKLLVFATVLNSIYIAADYMWFTALTHISVAVTTSISNTAPLFVYLLSICILHEPLSMKKVGAMFLSFLGVVFLTLYQDKPVDQAHTSVLACVLIVLQTILVAVYSVAYHLIVGDDLEDISTILVLTGFCGVVTIPLWITGSLFLAIDPTFVLYESLGWPSTARGLGLLFVSASLAGVNTTLQTFALLWTSPLVTNVGAMLTIPVSLLWDIVLNGRVFPWECFLGAVLIVVGFAILQSSSSRANDTKKKPSEVQKDA